MNLTELKTELVNDPAVLGYAQLIAAGDDTALAAILGLLNTPTYTVVKKRIITALGILDACEGGPMAAAAILDKLETAAASIPALKWVMRAINGNGIDIGSAGAQGMLDLLSATIGGNVLTTTEAGRLKTLGQGLGSRAEVVWGTGTVISNIDLIRTIYKDDGSGRAW